MEQKKPKVDIKAIMAKMKAKTNNVKESTKKVNSVVGTSKVSVKISKKPKSSVKVEKTKEVKSKKEVVLELYKKGLTVKEIMEKSRLNYTTVFGAVNDHQIKSLFEAGKNSEEIAKELGKNPKFVLSWLERYKFIKKA